MRLRTGYALLLFGLCSFLVSVARADPGAAAPPAPTPARTEPIKLGAIFSLTGFGAKGGVGELRAAQLAVDDLNARGGVAGRKVELIVEDNQSDFKATASAFNKLAQLDQIDALVGPNWSEFAEVVAPLAERAQVPMITPSGIFTRPPSGRYVFTLMAPPEETIRPLAQAVIESAGVTEVLGLVQDNVFTQNAWNASKSIWDGRVKINEVRISGAGSQDYRSILLRGARKPGVAVYAALLPGQYVALLRARQQLGLTVPVFGVDILYDDAVPADAALLKGVVATDMIALGSAAFRDAFVTRFQDKPLNYAAKAYDAVRLLAEANHECGRRNPSCLRSVDKYGESGHLRFHKDHGVVTDGPIAENYVFETGTWQVKK